MNSRIQRLRQVYVAVHKCKRCHAYAGGHIQPDPEKVQRKIFEGSVDSKIVLVGQSLAKGQVRLSGVPFHDTHMNLSRGGSYLERYFSTIGYTLKPDKLDRKLVYTTDMVQCFPGRKATGTGDNIPSGREINACLDWFMQEIEIVDPKVIILLGAPAARTFFEHVLDCKVKKVSDLYTERHDYEKGDTLGAVYVFPHSSSMVKGKSDIFQKSFAMIGRELITVS